MSLAFIFNILSSLIAWYIKRNEQNKQAQQDLIAFAEIMHRNGLRSVKMRLEAVDQIDRVNEEWDKEENEANKESNQ